MKPSPSTIRRFCYINNRINALLMLLKEGESASLRRKVGYWSKQLIKLLPEYQTEEQRQIIRTKAHLYEMFSKGYGDVSQVKIQYLQIKHERSVA